jgi:hypothetical protein
MEPEKDVACEIAEEEEGGGIEELTWDELDAYWGRVALPFGDGQ